MDSGVYCKREREYIYIICTSITSIKVSTMPKARAVPLSVAVESGDSG